MKAKTIFKKALAILLASALMLTSVCMFTSAYDEDEAVATFVNTSDSGKDQIALTTARSFKASLPITEAQAEAIANPSSVSWSLDRDNSKFYVSKDLFPNQKNGGALSSWKTSGNKALFSNIVSSVENIDGQNYLTLTFNSACYFGSDPSAPHNEGGAYLDVCGYFNLSASFGGEKIGSVAVKVAPYDKFHTMDEIYEELDELVDIGADSDIYVQKFSMGTSSGVIFEPLDMPYIIIAKDQDAVNDWLEFTDYAETDPTAALADIEAGVYDDIKVPVLYSNVHANEVGAADGVMAFARMIIEEAAYGDGKLNYNKFTGFTEEGEARLATEMGAVGKKNSLAIPDLIKDKATYLGFLTAGNRQSGVVDLDKYYEQEDVEVDLDELLDNVFFVLVPEENVEGRSYITREASNGYDLNRDNSFQTTPETANMQKLIGTFNPVSYTEFHGRVTGFQCEPCDPPHEPNFEYDLLADHLVTGGEAFGIAAVANNDMYNSYVMPQRDYLIYDGTGNAESGYGTYWSDPWDDMSTSYTPQFAMLQGTVAYTVELPGYNDAAAKLIQYGCLGQSDFIAAEKLGYLTSQTKIYERSVNNANSDAFELVGQWFCDQYDVEGAEADLFRPEFTGSGENGNFYPECYIIPMDSENQSNLSSAYEMMEWLSRNDVKILVTDKEFVYDGVTYPAGTMIISMYQAKRSVANGALYDGTLIENWTVLYSEGITSFGETRGFDMVTVTKPAAYANIIDACGDWMNYDECLDYLATLTSSFTGPVNRQVIVSNASEETVSAINTLLNEGKTVGMINDADSEYYGDFVITYDDWLTISQDYILSGTGIAKADLPAADIIAKAPAVYIVGTDSCTKLTSSGFAYSNRVNWSGGVNWNYDRVAMNLMNFTTVNNPADADVIVGSTALSGTALNKVRAGTPYIGYGSSVARTFSSLVTRGSTSGMDCLAYVTYPTTTLVNASYVLDGDDVMYGYGAGYFSKVPATADILVRVDSSRTPTEGFIPAISQSQKNSRNNFIGTDSIQGFAYQGNDGSGNNVNIALFANSLTHKGHQRDEYAYISNFIFANMLSGSYADAVYDAVNAVSISVDSDTVLRGANNCATFKVSARNLTGVSAMQGAVSLSDDRFEIADITVCDDSAVLTSKVNGQSAKFNLFKLPAFDDVENFDIVEITVVLKDGAELANGETLEAAINSFEMSFAGAFVECNMAAKTAVTAFHPTGVFGDVNGDDIVDLNDVTFAMTLFGKMVGDEGWYDECFYLSDINDDGIIDMEDLCILADLCLA